MLNPRLVSAAELADEVVRAVRATPSVNLVAMAAPPGAGKTTVLGAAARRLAAADPAAPRSAALYDRDAYAIEAMEGELRSGGGGEGGHGSGHGEGGDGVHLQNRDEHALNALINISHAAPYEPRLAAPQLLQTVARLQRAVQAAATRLTYRHEVEAAATNRCRPPGAEDAADLLVRRLLELEAGPPR